MPKQITNEKELSTLVDELGFLPFFKNDIVGFSVAEYTPRELWFTDLDGPWEWKGIAAKQCLYGKLFCGKAGFVSREWMPDLINYRRDGYDFDARYDDGLSSRKDLQLYEAVAASGSALTKELKATCGYGKNDQKGFETVITRLQMQTYVNVATFEYMRDKQGKEYGWGVARYTTPELHFGAEIIEKAYGREPSESAARILNHLAKILPNASEKQLRKMLG